MKIQYGPVGPWSDITPKTGFFVSLLNEKEAKKVSAMLNGGIWIIRIHLNPNLQVWLAKVTYDIVH